MDITGCSEVQAARADIARTFRNIRLFREMAALENVMAGRHIRSRSGLAGALLRDSNPQAEEREVINLSVDLLEFVGLKRTANQLAKGLPYGRQRRLEIARVGSPAPFAVPGRAGRRDEPG